MAAASMTFWRSLRVVFRKEIRESLRDRRTMGFALFGSLLLPVLVLVQIRSLEGKVEDARDVSVAIVRGEQMPSLVDALESRGVKVVPTPADPRADVVAGELSFVLELDDSFAQQWNQTGSGEIRLLYGDLGRTDEARLDAIRDSLRQVGLEIAVGRLANRGINPAAVLAPFQLKEERVLGEKSSGPSLLDMFGFLLLSAAFLSTTHMCIDASAGERERQSIEPLLLTGTEPRALVAGKALSTGLIGALVTVLGWSGSMFVWATNEGLLLSVPFSLPAALTAPLVFMSAIPLIVCLQLLVYSFARSFREAQLYASLLTLGPTMAGMLVLLAELDSELFLLLPLIGQQLLVQRVLSGDASGIEFAIVGVVLTLGLAVVCWLATSRLWQKESTIFSRGQ